MHNKKVLILGLLISFSITAQADNRKDIPVIIQALNTVLDTYATNDPLIWQNHQTGNYGEIVATSEIVSNCRNYKRTWVFDSGVDTYQGKACKNADGVWKPDSESKLKREPLTAQNDPLKIASLRAKDAQEQEARLKMLEQERLAEQRRLAEEERKREIERFEQEARLKKLEQERLAEKRRLAEEVRKREMAQDEANRIAAEKEKARLEAERLKREQASLAAEEARQSEKNIKLLTNLAIIIGAIVALVFFALLLKKLINTFLSSDYLKQHKAFSSLLKNNPKPKEMYRFLHEAQSIKRGSGYEALGSLCLLEEKIEDTLSQLCERVEVKPINYPSCQELCSLIEGDLKLYQSAAQALYGQPLAGILLMHRSSTKKWADGIKQEVISQAKEIINLFRPIGLSAEIEKLKPELDKRKQYLDSLPLDKHLDIFLERESEVTGFDEASAQPLSDLFIMLSKVMGRTNMPDIDLLADIPDDVARINQITTIVGIYNDKILAVEGDESLEENDKAESAEYLKRLRERDIAMLEGEI